jgi:hypothetical protein
MRFRGNAFHRLAEAHPTTRLSRYRHVILGGRDLQRRVRYRRIARIYMGRNDCRRGDESVLSLGVMGRGGHRRRGVRHQPDPQASNGAVGLSHDHYYWLRGDITCDVKTN